MSAFTQSNTVEQMILDAVTKLGGKQASMVREDGAALRERVARRRTAPGAFDLRTRPPTPAPA